MASLIAVGKESACNAGDPSLIPALGRSPGEGIGYPLWYSWYFIKETVFCNKEQILKQKKYFNEKLIYCPCYLILLL